MHYLYVDKLIEEKENALKAAEDALEETKDTVREMVFEVMKELGEISQEVYERIRNEKDINILKSIHKAAIKADCVEQLENHIN